MAGYDDPDPGRADRRRGERRTSLLSWTTLVPAVAFVALLATWGRSLPPVVVGVVGLLLAGAVLAAVHHAEVIALRVGEPFESVAKRFLPKIAIQTERAAATICIPTP